jgi:transcription termination factor Rho
MDRTRLQRKALVELREIASTLELRGYQRMKKADLVDLIIGAAGDSPAGGGNGAATRGKDAAAAQEPGAAGNGQRGRAPGGDDERGRAPGGDDEGGQARGGDDEGGQARGGDDEGGQARGGDDERGRASGGDDQRGPAWRDRESRDQTRGDDGSTRGADQPEQSGAADGHSRADDGQTRGSDARTDAEPSRNRSKRERRRKNRGPGGPDGAGAPGGSGQHHNENLEEAEVREGVLDLLPEGYGFLRVTGYLSGVKDVYVSQSFVRRYDLRRGDRVAGPIRRNHKNNDKFPALGRVDTVEGVAVAELDQLPKRAEFKDLTPLFPTERLRLAAQESAPIAMRLADMMAPIGKGQRGLIVSPPKAGKTTVLKQLAAAIGASDPDVHLMVVLVDERPEEVTDFQRSTTGEVISSTFDRPAEDHTQVAELTIERAKRLAERGADVVILLDSITRLGRAYNLAVPTTGRVMSGGIDSAALYPPKRFFGAARNIEEGGSLTIIATALIETGSKMDEVIFEEFKGTGNMELRLDRRMEHKRIFPAIDIQASGTRREELLLGRDEIDTVWKLRRLLASMDAEAALTLLIDKLKATKTNSQFLQMISKSNLQ